MPSSTIAASRPLAHEFMRQVNAHPDALAFDVYPSHARVPSESITWGEWGARVRACAASMLHAGVMPGDRVAVLAGNRPLWPVVDMAIQSIRAIGVGLYPSSTPAQVCALLADSGASLVFVDSEAHADVVRAARGPSGASLPMVVDAPVMAGAESAERFAAWCARGAALLQQDATVVAALQTRLDELSLDDIAALVYTSGSTGEPKGACLSHRYLAASAQSIVRVLGLVRTDRALSFLPYSHAAERVFGQCTRVVTGMSAALIENPSDLFPVASGFQPTVFGALPRIFERLYEAAQVASHEGRDPQSAITARVGSRVRIATSGGAALPITVGTTLHALGLPILGAYGQTEHLCVAMNRADAVRFDVVGPPMPGTVVRIADDGELLVERNALTFDRYWNRPDATRAAFTDDGTWLRTGDLAQLEPDGALRITGRVKELIALSNSRKIAPAPIEAALSASPFIAHAYVYGEGHKYPVCLLTLRRDMVQSWASAQGLAGDWSALVQEPLLHSQLQQAIDTVNESLARTDRIQSFMVTADEFSVARGDLTPTLKLVRSAIDARYRAELDALYSSPTYGRTS